MGHTADLCILDKRKKSLGFSGNPHADRLARSMVNISIMPFHAPLFMVLLYIMRFTELCGLCLKINVISCAQAARHENTRVTRRSGQTFRSQVIFGAKKKTN